MKWNLLEDAPAAPSHSGVVGTMLIVLGVLLLPTWLGGFPEFVRALQLPAATAHWVLSDAGSAVLDLCRAAFFAGAYVHLNARQCRPLALFMQFCIVVNVLCALSKGIGL